MARRPDLIRWLVKPVAWVACLGPLAWLVRGIVTADLGADPVKTLTHTGLFYNDTLARTPDGWRIVERYEELSWSGAPGPQ